MANGFGSLYVGASGLQNSQNALNTTANNLANVGTKGYVRQQVRFADRNYNKLKDPSIGVNMQQYGLGLAIGDVEHARDIFKDKLYRQETGRKEFYSKRYEITCYTEDLLQELHGLQFKESINDLWKAFQEVSTKPEVSVYQNLVLEKAELFTTRTQKLYEDVQNYQYNINEQIKEDVGRVNEIGNRIYELNLQIQNVEAGGVETAMTLRDERDNLLDELGGYGEITVREDPTGFTFVDFESTSFVDDNRCYNIELKKERDTGFYTPYWKQLSNVDEGKYVNVFHKDEVISSELNTDIGSLKSKLLERGDKFGKSTDMADEASYDKISISAVVTLEAQLDSLYNKIVTSMNDIYCPNKELGTTITDTDGNTYGADTLILDEEECARGVDGELPPRELFTRAGLDRYKKVQDRTSGKTYYVYNKPDPADKDTLYNIENVRINEELKHQITLMPAYKKNGDIALDQSAKLSKAWEAKDMRVNPYDKNPCTFEDYYDKVVGNLAEEGNLYQTATQTCETSAKAFDNKRLEVMGVSSDEELTNMIKFQAAYNASSRFMTVISQMTELIVTGLK